MIHFVTPVCQHLSTNHQGLSPFDILIGSKMVNFRCVSGFLEDKIRASQPILSKNGQFLKRILYLQWNYD